MKLEIVSCSRIRKSPEFVEPSSSLSVYQLNPIWSRALLESHGRNHGIDKNAIVFEKTNDTNYSMKVRQDERDMIYLVNMIFIPIYLFFYTFFEKRNVLL